MTASDVFPVEPWAVTEPALRLDLLGRTESVFALSNGHIGLRGNLDEGEPHAVPGSYLNGFFESIPLPYAEDAYGYPDTGQSLIDVADGKLIRLLVDDEPFDVRQGTLHEHARRLDLRAGVLERTVTWTSPAGQTVRIRSTRLVSFVQRAVVAVDYEVEAVGGPARVVVQSVLQANEAEPEGRDDPRAAFALQAPLVGELLTSNDLTVSLGHRTRQSGLRVAAAMDHIIDGPDGTVASTETSEDLGRVTLSTELKAGATLRVVKLLAYGWSSRRSMPALRDQVDAAVAAAHRTGWDGLVAEQRAYLDDVWDRADIELDGDERLQQAMRFALFQILQAGARAERRAIPAKGLTGRGYDGHTFWDMEMYALPVLTYTLPVAARDALLWRHDALPFARERAAELGLRGAAFPWRTISGPECSGYWPAGTAGFHVNADIAEAVRRYVDATGDEAFESGAGIELLVATARLWMSIGHHDAEGCFRIDGVTGPDEYSALGDNNVFTNLMAARNLLTADRAAERHPDRARELGVDRAERKAWLLAAESVVVPYDDALGITPQAEGFTRYRRWDFDQTTDEYPLLLHHPYYRLYSSQVVKQADLVFAIFLFGDRFDADQKRRDFDYYEAITVRDSTLSASIQSIVAAEVGHRDLAYRYWRESAFVDLDDLAGNTADGLHLASLAGAWMAAVHGFGGMRDHGETVAFSPQLPPGLQKLTIRLLVRGRRLRIDITSSEVGYEIVEGAPLDIVHEDAPLTLRVGHREAIACTPKEDVPAAEPPRSREPMHRGVGADDVSATPQT
ncbi:MAG TPA: glycosyl hydrolase family 65 protein [Acidimicrobiales bacterium]|nr:glycosyl hydrolase family 65 protein [Acidimicrobiales bacterium]